MFSVISIFAHSHLPLSVLVALAATGGAATELTNVSESELSPATGGPHLLWQNTVTGEMSAWVLDGSTVIEKQPLSWRCGAADGCSSEWSAFDTYFNTILWYGPTSGRVQSWWFDHAGAVQESDPLSWTCTAASGCAANWRLIGGTEYRDPNCHGPIFCDPLRGILWHNPGTGELSRWNIASDGHTIIDATPLSWRCGDADGCSRDWRPLLTADFNRDGNSDVLWHNADTGMLSSWLLGGATGSTVLGKQPLSWSCDTASGCAQVWRVVDAGDVNRDGNVDLTWHDATTGEVSTWLLNSAGTVTGASVLSWTCGPGCAPDWKAVGFVGFPPPPLH